MPKRKSKRRVSPKYVFRRALLILLVLGVLGAGGWQLSRLLLPEEKEEALSEPEALPPPSSQPPASSAPPVLPEPSAPEESAAEWNLLLVSAESPLPEGFSVELETVVDSYKVDKRIAGAVKRMFTQAKEDGIELVITSAYRDIAYQQGLLEKQLERERQAGKPEEEALRAALMYVAAPGTSEHHTGLALDIISPDYTLLDDGYAETPAARWLAANAWKYGFILRYPQDKVRITGINFEPWHYRYVGEEHAGVIHENGYCLEEYLYGELKSKLWQQNSAASGGDGTPEEETPSSGTPQP